MAKLGSQAARQQELSRLMLEKARQDLRAVIHLRTEASIADETVGFHVQQTIEKAIKAVLIRHGLGAQHCGSARQLLSVSLI